MSPAATASEKHLVQRIIGAIGDFFVWAKDALAEESVRRVVLSDLGLDPSSPARPAIPQDRLDSIERYRASVSEDDAAMRAALEDVRAVSEAIRGFCQAASGGTGPVAEEITHRLFKILVVNYLRVKVPLLYWFGQAAGFLEEAFSTELIPEPVGEGIVDVLKRIGGFFKDPIAHFKRIDDVAGAIWPIETLTDARVLAGVTLAPLGIGIGVWRTSIKKRFTGAVEGPGLPLFGWEPGPESPTPNADLISAAMLSFAIPGIREVMPPADQPPADPCALEAEPPPLAVLEGLVSISLAWVPSAHGGPGLFIGLGGSSAVEIPIGDGWKWKLELGSAGAVDFLIRDLTALPPDIDVHGPSDASLTIRIERPPDPEGPYVLTAGDSVRLEFGRLAWLWELSSEGPALRFRADQSALVIPADRDPVLDRAAPADHLRVDFDLEFGFAGSRFAFYIGGGAGFRATRAINKALGPLRIQTLTLGLTPSTEPGAPDLALETSLGLAVRLGPVALSVDRIGFETNLTFDDGSVDLGFKPPEGVGIVIESSVVTGGGYLFHDREKAQYAGVLELAFEDLFGVSFNAKAIGLLTTKMPDGSRGFSFLVILSIEDFPPVQLGFGFSLTGIGGLFGLDRTVNFEALQAGLSNKTLDRLLFPEDPVANAPAIVSAAGAVFPPRRDQMVFGPLFQISWGHQGLVTIELGLLLEFPAPARLVILGKLRAIFPTKEAPTARIQLDLVGEIDFERQRLFVHARLVDSKIAGFPLSGAAALLMVWDDSDPSLTLALGGVHPDYERRLPAGFPKLERLSVPISKGNNPKLRLELYFAVTSNSLQIGGKLEAAAGIGKFTIEGFLAVNALVEFPFRFQFDLKARVQLKAYGVNLFAVTLEGKLSGPRPWHARGKATFEIWIFDYSVSFDASIGSAESTPPLPAVNVGDILLTALRDVRNWTPRLARAEQNLVALRKIAPTSILLLHPLGTLGVTQSAVPLGVTIQRLGAARPRGEAKFEITHAEVGGSAQPRTPVTEQFARGQFFDLTDDQRLTSPSFERMAAGANIGSTAVRHGPAVEATTECDTLVYDAVTGTARPVEPYVVPASRLAALAAVSSAAVNAPARTGRGRYRVAAAGVRVAQPRYAIADRDDLAVQVVPGTGDGGATSYTAAVEALRRHVVGQPADRARLQVIATFASAP